MSTAALWGGLSVAVGLVGQVYYFRGIVWGGFRPHAFSYLVYALLTGIALAAQIAGGAGSGIWVTAFTAGFCLFVAVHGFWKKGIDYVTRSDWVILLGCLAAIPLWLVTDTPLYSVILISCIDGAATIPMIRKAWTLPHEDSVFAYAIASLKFAIGLPAIEHFTWVTALYPVTVVLVNALVVVVLLLRRRVTAHV